VPTSRQVNPTPNAAPQPKSNPTLEAALSYARRGLAVFRGTYKTKSPLKGSHSFYDATTDQLLITELFSQGSYNVLMRTGHASGVAVLDIDAHRHGFESLEAMIDAYGPPRETDGPKIITGNNGWQFPFQMPTESIRSGVDVFGFPGIDIKAEGGYVVAPPAYTPMATLTSSRKGEATKTSPSPGSPNDG
jgi:hypothetical protein